MTNIENKDKALCVKVTDDELLFLIGEEFADRKGNKHSDEEYANILLEYMQKEKSGNVYMMPILYDSKVRYFYGLRSKNNITEERMDQMLISLINKITRKKERFLAADVSDFICDNIKEVEDNDVILRIYKFDKIEYIVKALKFNKEIKETFKGVYQYNNTFLLAVTSNKDYLLNLLEFNGSKAPYVSTEHFGNSLINKNNLNEVIEAFC